MTSYEYSTSPRLTFTFKNSAGTETDPDAGTMQLKFGTPDGTVMFIDESDITHVRTGIFRYSLLTPSPGDWAYRIVGSVSGILISDGNKFTITKSVR